MQQAAGAAERKMHGKGSVVGHKQPRLSGPLRLRARVLRAHQADTAPQPRGSVPLSSPGSARRALALQLTLARRAKLSRRVQRPRCAA